MKFTCITCLIIVELASYPLLVSAQIVEFKNQIANTHTQFESPKFPDNGAPTGRRKGGTSRDGCPPLTTPLTAIVPGEEIKNESKSFLSLTISEHPTFWIYVPDLPSNIQFGEFLLQDENDKNIYQLSLSLPNQASIIGITLPSSQKSVLKLNKNYQWYLKVFCGDPQKTSEYFYVKAWVQRVPLTSTLERQLKSAQTKEYTIYIANQIWQDALTNLAILHRTYPNSHTFTEDWAFLLKAVGLEKFVAAPILQPNTLVKGVTQSN